MPKISEFYGITIYMYWGDHSPPHFHAMYSGAEAEIAIATGKLIDGTMPRAARRMLKIWARVHHRELFANWRRARSGEALTPIAPLE